MRVGWGFDAHRFGAERPLLLAGVEVDPARGVVATSDGDVVAHAVADALLGASAAGDLGEFFPSSDSRWVGADSMELLVQVRAEAAGRGWIPQSVDVTVVVEAVRIAPHRQAMRTALAGALDLELEAVSVKATTTDGLGFAGAGEGLAAVAVVVAAPA